MEGKTKCAACGGQTKRVPFPKAPGIWTCERCGCIQGTCYVGESYQVVSNSWAEEPEIDHHTVAYDMETLGPKGIGRRHGWCSTRQLDSLGACRIVQVG